MCLFRASQVFYVWTGSGLDGFTGPRGRACNKIPLFCLSHWSSCNVLHASPNSGKPAKMVKMISRNAKRIILLDNAICCGFKVTGQWIKIIKCCWDEELEQNEFLSIDGERYSTNHIYIYNMRRQEAIWSIDWVCMVEDWQLTTLNNIDD